MLKDVKIDIDMINTALPRTGNTIQISINAAVTLLIQRCLLADVTNTPLN